MTENTIKNINFDYIFNEVKPITYALKKQNKKIGIITTMTLKHATPAAFYASATNRGEYDDIAYDLVNSNFDYFAGGKIELNSKTEEEIKEYAKNNGYEIIENVDDCLSKCDIKEKVTDYFDDFDYYCAEWNRCFLFRTDHIDCNICRCNR